MEDPPNDVKDVVRGLVQTPTLKRQAAVMRKYFTPNVKFYHFYINTNGGLEDLTAIYQVAELFLNYRSVDFEKIIYDEQENAMALKMTVHVRPWFLLFTLVCMKFFTLLELEDYRIEGGKTVKKIKVQRDYFERAPLIQMIPVFGRIYDSDSIRFFIGGLQATAFESLRTFLYLAFPANLWHGMLGMWSHKVAGQEGMKGKEFTGMY